MGNVFALLAGTSATRARTFLPVVPCVGAGELPVLAGDVLFVVLAGDVPFVVGAVSNGQLSAPTTARAATPPPAAAIVIRRRRDTCCCRVARTLCCGISTRPAVTGSTGESCCGGVCGWIAGRC